MTVRVVVTGTGTEVGKTWMAARVLEQLRQRGHRVAARKPLQSYAPDDDSTDADVLATATGEAVETVCPADNWFTVPMAPPMAATALGRRCPDLDEVLAVCRAPDETDVLLVEGAGGVRSPLTSDGDTASLITRSAPDVVVVVADAGLGTVNAVRLTLTALPIEVSVVVLNRFDDTDPLHRANATWLRDIDDFTVFTEPHQLVQHIESRIDGRLAQHRGKFGRWT